MAFAQRAARSFHRCLATPSRRRPYWLKRLLRESRAHARRGRHKARLTATSAWRLSFLVKRCICSYDQLVGHWAAFRVTTCNTCATVLFVTYFVVGGFSGGNVQYLVFRLSQVSVLSVSVNRLLVSVLQSLLTGYLCLLPGIPSTV